MSETEKISKLKNALRGMMIAYERRIRSECKSAEDLAKEPWRCAEYVAAEQALKLKLLMPEGWLRDRILADPDSDDPQAGPDLANITAPTQDHPSLQDLPAHLDRLASKWREAGDYREKYAELAGDAAHYLMVDPNLYVIPNFIERLRAAARDLAEQSENHAAGLLRQAADALEKQK